MNKKWTPQQRRHFTATMKAKRAARSREVMIPLDQIGGEPSRQEGLVLEVKAGSQIAFTFRSTKITVRAVA